MGVTNASGLLFGAFGNSIQKIQDLVRCDVIQGLFAKIVTKFGKDRLVSRNRIFFVSWTCDNPARVLPLAWFSFFVLLVLGFVIVYSYPTIRPFI